MLRYLKKIIKSIYFQFQRVALAKKNVIIDSNVLFFSTNFSTNIRIFKNTDVSKSLIGSYSYVSNDCILYKVKMGSFSSVGPRVEIIYGTHPVQFISTNPVFYSTRNQCGTSFVKKNLYPDFNLVPKTGFSALIGNDVWIGYGAKIVEGITIGDGAIILAGAYVTKDVNPYSIVGGIPAKHIRFRFSEEERNMLLKFKWWEKDIDWIKKNSACFMKPEAFMALIAAHHESQP